MDSFDSIRIAVNEYCEFNRAVLLDDILTDFSNECKDESIIATLETILNSYRVMSSPTSSPTSSPRSCTKSPIVSPHPKVAPSAGTAVVNTVTPAVVNTCCSIMKTGLRKGQECGGKVHLDGLCKRHQPKIEVDLSEEKCSAIMKTGMRKGQLCGAKVPNGENYCCKHKITKCVYTLENGECCGRNISLHSPTETHCRIHIKTELSLDTTKFITAINRFGNMEHRYSGLIFENKKVVGAQHPSGTIVSVLNDDDFECVITYGLPLDPSFTDKLQLYLNKKKQK